MNPRLPILILAGSDQRSGPFPAQLDAQQMLSGFKGTIPFPTGGCLLSELISRFRASGRFDDPIVVGPRNVFEDLVDCEIVDVQGSLVSTLERVRDLVRLRFPADAHVAVSACDILPTVDEIQQLIASGFDTSGTCHFWWQFIAAEPDELGASSWKPQYCIRATDDAAVTKVYPGHLIIFRPRALRIDLLIRLLTLAYRYRNLPFNQRILPMLVRGVGTLFCQDIRNLSAGQLPILAASIPWHVARAYREMQLQVLTVERLERHMGRVLLHRDFRRTDKPVVVTLSRILSFAQDIDCQAELEEAIARLPCG